MPRPPRIWFPGAIYHIIQRGNEQRDIFREDADCIWFLKTVEEAKKALRFKIYLYVLMGNHYHITLEASQDHISKIMQFINSVYAIRFNTKYHRQGHLFQGRFKGLLVDKDNYLLELSRYIHLNPVKAGFVKRPEDYRWSSYRVYAYRELNALVDTELILEQFRSVLKNEYKEYRDFVNEGILNFKEEQDWLKVNLKRQRFLGNKDFVEALVKKSA